MMKIIAVVRDGGDPVADADKMVGAYESRHGWHFTEELAEWACRRMVNRNGTEHMWTAGQVRKAVGETPGVRVTDGDLMYVANMAYADFYPQVLREQGDCIAYARAVAEDADGYEGQVMARWLADVRMTGTEVPWEKFV